MFTVIWSEIAAVNSDAACWMPARKLAGAACVVGLMQALAARKAKVNAVGAIGLVENAVDGKAQRPGDIVTEPDTLLAAEKAGRLVQEMKKYIRPQLLLVDELGYLPIDKRGADLLFQVISQRYGRGSIALTTNLGIASWGRIFDDPTVAAAMRDRLLHRSVVFNIDGDSYRMRAPRARAENARKGVVVREDR